MSKKILLADDSITIQKVVELTFSDGDYEVIATSNGSKAMEEIPKVKPDIILSDIIMPEKNGYELCEWVKSHPEYRHIPVILLTGTFEPFDPDRAEKAGCDAVVTKPFESQSLIQKVEELIGRSAGMSPAAGTEPEEEPLSGYDDLSGGPEAFAGGSGSTEQDDQEDQDDEAPTPFGGFSPPPPQSEPESTPFPAAEEEAKPHGDIFSDEVAPGGDPDGDDTATRMIPKMSMEDIERMRGEQRDEPSSFDESPAPPFEEAPEAPDSFEEDSSSSPFEAPGEDSMEDDATRMMPKLSMEDIRRLQEQDETEDAAEAEQPALFGGASASEEASDDEDAPFGSEDSPAPPPTEEPETAYGSTEETAEEFDDSSTQMIPRMAFDEGFRTQEDEEEDESAPESPEPIESSAFRTGAPGPADDSAAANPFTAETEQDESFTAESERSSSFDSDDSEEGPSWESEQRAQFEEQEAAASHTEEAPSFDDDEPAPHQSEPERSLEDDETFPYKAEQSTPFTEAEPELLPPPPLPPEEPVTREPEPEATAGTMRAEEDSAAAASLSEEQIDRIARRVVELLSDKAVREIAWEVIPETAEMIVRERIRELEGEDA